MPIKSRKLVEVNVNSTIVQHARQINTQLHQRVIEIGDWDMDDVANISVNIEHGVDPAKVRGLRVYIRGDVGSVQENAVAPLDYYSVTGASGFPAGGAKLRSSNSHQVYCARREGDYFDNASYDATSFNRGWIIIDYID